MDDVQTETIQLDPSESNELLFKVQIEGTEANTPVKVRLVCESENMSYMFKGEATHEIDMIRFTLPPMKGKIAEGSVASRVEVLVENRYFVPVNFNIDFKQPVTVVAESVKVVQKKKPAEIKVTAAPVVVAKSPATKQDSAPVKTLKERAGLLENVKSKKVELPEQENSILTADVSLLRRLARELRGSSK